MMSRIPLALCTLGSLLMCAFAAAPAPSVTPALPSSPHPSQSLPASGAAELTAADLEAWLDGFLPFALEEADIAGGAVVVVAGGQVLLQKGYEVVFRLMSFSTDY